MKAIRIGICLLVTFTVLAHGAIEPWSETVLEAGAAALLLLWAGHAAFGEQSELIWNPLLAPLLAFWGVVAIQLLVGVPKYPFLTRIELLKYTAVLALFFLCVQSFRTREHWHGFVWFLLVLGFAVSLFGILQYFTFNGKLYWVRELPYGGIPFGPFENRDHFAGFMELLIPPGLAIVVLRGERRDQLPLIALFTLFPIGAVFLSASRGGILSVLGEVAFLAVLIVLYQRRRQELVSGAVVVTLGALLVSWLGVGVAIERFASYQKLEVSEAHRIAMMRGSWHIFLDHPVIGTGLGTLPDVYPPYETLYDGKIVNHSHNDYLEGLSDTGIVGGICAAALLFLLFSRALKILAAERQAMNFAYHAGALVACFGLLIHATVDFNFHIPSTALVFLLQAALATSAIPEFRHQQRS